MREETFAITPRFPSTAPVLSTMTSSENGYSLSLTTKGQRSPQYLLPLLLYFCWTYRIPLKIQHIASWRLQPQTLVAGKMFAALEVLQIFVVTMSQHKDVLATNTQNKWLGFVVTSAGPVTMNCPTLLAPKFSSSCTSFWTVTVAGAHPCCSHRNLCHWCRPPKE